MSTLRAGLLGTILLTSLAVATHARAGDTDDTVFLKNGGRARGTVMTEDPKQGVKVKLADGSVKVIPAAEVDHVEYRSAAPAAAPEAAPAPAPAPVEQAPAPAPPPAAPLPPEQPRTIDTGSDPGEADAPSGWQHDHFGFGVGGELGIASADPDHGGIGPWIGLHGAVDIPLFGRFYLRADPSIVLHTATLKTYEDHPDSSGNYQYGNAENSFTLTLLMVRAMAGFDINPMFTVRAGGFFGVGTGSVTTTFNGDNICPSGSATGPTGGGSIAGALRLGAARRQEIALMGDAGIIPAAHCRRYSSYDFVNRVNTPGEPYYKANDDDPGLSVNVQYVYLWW